MVITEDQTTTATKLKRIAWLSSLDKHKQFNQLMHHFNEESLQICFQELNRKKAIGRDGVDKENYGANLQENLKSLVSGLKTMSYSPGNIREVVIPKEGKKGKTRTLGISNFEDKIIQKMMHKVLESIYEPLFLKSSYGFRAGRGCHDAIRALRNHLYMNEVERVIDIDLANFFGTIDRKILLQIISEKIKDKKLLRYIARMFKAGILSNGELTVQDEGVVQGNISSPILANIFAHYVIDEWFEDVVKHRCKGKVELFRYCDDSVICCQYESDAKRIRTALTKRLGKYNLALNEEKTKMVRFSKREREQGIKQESFDFLGFTFYLGKSRASVIIPKLKSSGARIRSKLKKVNDWCKSIRNKCKMQEIWKRFCVKLEGHIRYYGVSFNREAVSAFIYRARCIIFKWLNCRSQRKSFTWEKFLLYLQKHPLPKVKIYHSLF